MRCLLLAVVAGLAVLAVQIRAEEPVVEEEIVLDEIELSDERIARMLGDIFDEEDFEEALEEQESNREARARGDDLSSAVEEEKAAVDSKDQARYNSFIDTFLRRLNSFARSRFDPLSVGLSKKGKSSKSGKDKKGKKDTKKDKKGGKKSGKKGKKGGKKNRRHPKDLDLDEVAEEREEAVDDAEEEEEAHEIKKRDAEIEVFEIDEEEEEEEAGLEEDEAEEDSPVRVARDAEEESDDSALEETSRRGKPAKGAKKGSTKKGGKKKGNKKGGKGKKSGKKGGKKSGKKGGKNSKKSKRSAKKTGPRTSRASVTGIATLRRDGDVLVRNKNGGKEMRTKFTIGPVQLKVNRKFGTGKKTITKEAMAVAPELKGKLSIQVAQNGKAKMTNFRINRPSIVQVQGSLHKTTQGGKSDNNFMENSIGRFSPVATKKLKLASREILSAGEPKANVASN